MKNTKKLLSLLLVVLLFSACATQKADQKPPSQPEVVETSSDESVSAEAGFSVVDALGREVSFTEYPSKIVVAGKLRPMILDFLYLFESSPEKILAVEAGGQGSQNFLELLDENVESKFSLEKGATAEQIAPLEPDLVILKSSMKESVGDQLETIGIPVIYVDFEDMEQTYRDVRILGTVLGESGRAEELVAKYEELYAEFKGYVSADTEGKNVVLIQVSDSDNQYAYEVPSVAYLQTYMVADAGGQVMWADAAQAGGWNEVNLEQVNVWDPDTIIVINYQGNAENIISDLEASQPFSSLKAVANDRVLAFPYDYISWDQPDSRWILGYSWLVYQLNPNAIGQDRMLQEVNDFYQFFYGLDQQQVEENILPKIQKYY